jgi:hypothetical protein
MFVGLSLNTLGSYDKRTLDVARSVRLPTAAPGVDHGS